MKDGAAAPLLQPVFHSVTSYYTRLLALQMHIARARTSHNYPSNRGCEYGALCDCDDVQPSRTSLSLSLSLSRFKDWIRARNRVRARKAGGTFARTFRYANLIAWITNIFRCSRTLLTLTLEFQWCRIWVILQVSWGGPVENVWLHRSSFQPFFSHQQESSALRFADKWGTEGSFSFLCHQLHNSLPGSTTSLNHTWRWCCSEPALFHELKLHWISKIQPHTILPLCKMPGVVTFQGWLSQIFFLFLLDWSRMSKRWWGLGNRDGFGSLVDSGMLPSQERSNQRLS